MDNIIPIIEYRYLHSSILAAWAMLLYSGNGDRGTSESKPAFGGNVSLSLNWPVVERRQCALQRRLSNPADWKALSFPFQLARSRSNYA